MLTYELSNNAPITVRLRNCADDVTVIGRDGNTIEITAGDQETLADAIDQSENTLTIEDYEDALTLRVPRGTRIDADQLDSDVTITDVQAVRIMAVSGSIVLRTIAAEVELDSVDGDCVLENVGSVTGQHIAGDARIVRAGNVDIREIDGDLRVSDVPRVQIERASSDAVITGVAESCQIDIVEGDLTLRDVGPTTLGSVSGDLTAERVRSLSANVLDGDCTLNGEDGPFQIGKVSGDLVARLAAGPLTITTIKGDASVVGLAAGMALARVKGDLAARLNPAGAAEYRADVGGDAAITLPSEANISITAEVEGSLVGLRGGRGRRGERVDRIDLAFGSGDAKLSLTVGGDLALRGLNLPGLQAARGVTPPAPPQPPRPVAPVMGPTVRLNPDMARRAPHSEASDEERLAILRMVADGRLSVEDAEGLLVALDARSV